MDVFILLASDDDSFGATVCGVFTTQIAALAKMKSYYLEEAASEPEIEADFEKDCFTQGDSISVEYGSCYWTVAKHKVEG